MIVGLRYAMGEKAFTSDFPLFFGLQGGWRIPFLGSVFLLAVSVWIRMQMHESPAFKKMKEEGTQSKAPLSEAFGQWRNMKIVILALAGLVIGQAVVWYTGQFYALFFLQAILKVDLMTANVLIAWSLILGTGFFLVFGALSDRIGRKPVILAGCFIAAVTYFPLFTALTNVANPTYAKALETVKIQVAADPTQCGSLFDPVGIRTFTQPCDNARRVLSQQAFRYELVNGPAGQPMKVTVNGTDVAFTNVAEFTANISKAAIAAGYPAANDAAKVRLVDAQGNASIGTLFPFGNAQALAIIAILTVMVIYVTMVYGPIAAALVEFFPTRIRYTAMSLPYHIGNGWFGGLLPATSFAIVASTGDIYAGLWYPIGFALMTFVIGLLFVPQTHKRDIFSN